MTYFTISKLLLINAVNSSPLSKFWERRARSRDCVIRRCCFFSVLLFKISANPGAPSLTYQVIRSAFSNTIIYCNGLTVESAEAILQENSADLVAFGRSFLANPDFVKRIEENEPLNAVNDDTLYTPDAVGYKDYSKVQSQLS